MARASHRLTENVKLLQKAVVVHRGEVLLLQRDAQSATRALQWDLPGGNSEWPVNERSGKSLHAHDIAREIQEETTIHVIPEQFKQDALLLFDTYFLDDIFTILVGWMVELPDDFDRSTVGISHEHQEAKWEPFEEATSYDFGFANEFIIPMIRRAKEKVHG